MKTIRKLEQAIGGRWLGVSIYSVPVKCKEEYACPQLDRFCEALKMGTVKKVLVDPRRFTCLGARYAFGYGDDRRDAMIEKLVDTKGYSPRCAAELIAHTPHCVDGVEAIGINLSKKPDVFIAQLQPAQVMRLLRIYQERLGKVFQTEISSVIAACGNVFVKAIQRQDMAISFGCDDSRAYGDVARDRLYAGLPSAQARLMTA